MEATGAQQTRSCVGCGRAISWDANVCPYCGHDYRAQMMAPARPPQYSEGMKILLYLVSFFFSIIGIIIGLVLYTKDDPESKEVGKVCLVIGVIMLLVGGICVMAGVL